ncbi:hypothetical protein BDR07DRAFT_1491719 [Suillus spraguei]|nr:hypothetical protein BDR07DRAFT_1492577 [Suillus spraguei]KAG2356623.1 hypothetical protein BDR07DRAFT_1491719 [Suillus spraguei]
MDIDIIQTGQDMVQGNKLMDIETSQEKGNNESLMDVNILWTSQDKTSEEKGDNKSLMDVSVIWTGQEKGDNASLMDVDDI